MSDEDDTAPAGESVSATDDATGGEAAADEAVPESVLADRDLSLDGVQARASLVDWAGEADPETVATLLTALEERVTELSSDRASLEQEVEELDERVKRIQADFQNYKKRTERRREEEQAQATRDLVERLLPVRDNLERAVDQDADVGIREGVQATLAELDEVLASEEVDPIEPSPGDPIDPQRHEVVHREDEEADVISTMFRRGYEMGGAVIRPAQVTVGADTATDDTATPDGSE